MAEDDLDADKEISKITSIYEGELDFNTIKDNPILKPIAEINETFVNLELVINKALIDYQEIEDEINKMVEENPVYSETMLMAKIQSLKVNVKQIIHSQDLQKANMKVKINDMIKIAEEEYDLRGTEDIIQPEPKPETTEETKKEIPEEDVIKKLKKIAGEEETEKPSGEKETSKYSDLVEREIPI